MAVLVWLFLFALYLIVSAIIWPYSINEGLIYFHKPAQIVAWQGALIGLIPGVGQLGIPVSFITWVVLLTIS